MVDTEVTTGQAVDFIRGVRALLGNRRGKISPRTIVAIDRGLEEMREGCEEIARTTLRENKSEGPPLSESWTEEKLKSWLGYRWYVDSSGTTFQVTRPTFAIGPWHKAVWSGFLDSELTSWIEGGKTIAHPPEIFVGYKATGNLHPINGFDGPTLSAMIHLGFHSPQGNMIPPRPYLTAKVAMDGYKRVVKDVMARIFSSLLTGGVP